jgi:hypothetical protein
MPAQLMEAGIRLFILFNCKFPNMKLPSFFIIVLIIPLLLASCKKEYICSSPVQYWSPSIAFAGFSESEIKSIIIWTYKENTDFSELLSTDSLAQSSIVFKSDTAFSKFDTLSKTATGFKSIHEGYDYKIQCLQNGKMFLITNIASGDSVKTWVKDTECPFGAGQTISKSVSFNVNGVAAYPGRFDGYSVYYNSVLFLSN